MEYWERNRAVFRVVELTTVEGDLRFQGLRVRALNAVTVTLARVIATNGEGSGSPAGLRSDGRGGNAHRHAGPGGRAPLRIRILGHPHRLAGRQPGPPAPLVGDRPARSRGGQGPGAETPLPRTGPVVGGGAAAARTAQVKAASAKAKAKMPSDQNPSARQGPDHRTGALERPTGVSGRLAVPGLQRTATGLTGEPRALVKGSGVASSRNSYLPSAAQASANSSRNQF